MKKLWIIKIIFILLLISPLFSQADAVIKEVSGKVEVKAPQKGWVPARAGMSISNGTVISTGFKSKALLELGSAELFVNQLTRMRLDELIRQGGIQTTGLYLKVGKVKAKVKSAKGLTHNFKLRSPMSTAAVRGTDFDYQGFSLKVAEGIVEFFNQLNQRRTLLAGEHSSTDGIDMPSDSEQEMTSLYGVSVSLGSKGVPSENFADFTGGIILEIQ